MVRVTGRHLICKALKLEGIRNIFGLAGDHILPVLKSCANIPAWKIGTCLKIPSPGSLKTCPRSPTATGWISERLTGNGLTNPKAAVMNAKEMVDVCFVKELDDTGLIQSLDKK